MSENDKERAAGELAAFNKKKVSAKTIHILVVVSCVSPLPSLLPLLCPKDTGRIVEGRRSSRSKRKR
jgi:hypothetical protein